MGCGQSQFSLIYPKKFKRKDHKNKDGKDDDSDEENEDDKHIGGRLFSNRSIPNLVAAADKEEHLLDNSKLPNSTELSSSSSLFAHKEMTSSQIEFFKMLDEKIENGPDYDEMNEKERLMECTRMRQLLLEWERAKQKRFPFQNQTNQVVQTGAAAASASASASAGAISAQPRKHLFSMPHLNGDVNKKFSYQVYTIRHQMQYDTSQNTQQNQFMLSNSVVLYDQARGQYYTELA